MRLANQTRVSPSIPRRLIREKKFHLLPLYLLLRLSVLGREAIEHSGSFRFADHIYLDEARGRLGLGWLVDAIMLRFPSTRSFRNRFVHAQTVIWSEIQSRSQRLRVASLPSGIPRELIEVALRLRAEPAGSSATTLFLAMDADLAPLLETRRILVSLGLTEKFRLIVGEALAIPLRPRIDVITSTGLVEFLEDDEAARFYSGCYAVLDVGGVLSTSLTVRHRLSVYLLESIAELFARYRDEDDVPRLLDSAPWQNLSVERDPVGYQVLISARKE